MAASLAHVFGQVPRWTSGRQAGDVSDTVLLERFVQRRDEAAFAALVARHGAMVLRLCRRILGDVQDAEDAFQATFVILARKAYSLKQPEALPGWLYGVARRVALKARRQSARRSSSTTPLCDTLPDPRPDPLTQLTARELLDILDEEVQRLPAAQRSSVVLCCLEGHTQEEVARILGWTPGSVRGRLERGRRRLHARLARRGIALPAVLAIAGVSRGEAASALLQGSAVRAALGGIASQGAALAESVLKEMLLSKLANLTALGMTIALAVSAYQAIRKLAASPTSAIPFLRKRLPSAPLLDDKRVAHLIADLDSDDFATRQKAVAELEKFADQPLTAYRRALEGKPSIETRRRLDELLEKAGPAWWDVTGERLRSLRAVEALELAGTKEARAVLETVAQGAAGVRLTEQARAALQRLAQGTRD